MCRSWLFVWTAQHQNHPRDDRHPRCGPLHRGGAVGPSVVLGLRGAWRQRCGSCRWRGDGHEVTIEYWKKTGNDIYSLCILCIKYIYIYYIHTLETYTCLLFICVFGIEKESVTWRCFFSEFAPGSKKNPPFGCSQAAEEAKAVHFGGDEDAIFMLGAKRDRSRGFFGVWGYTQTKMF